MEIDPKKHIHGKNLEDYARKHKTFRDTCYGCLKNAYQTYRTGFDEITSLGMQDIHKAVKLLNQYRAVAVPVFDGLNNAGQKALGYTIMEEFFYLLFNKLMQIHGICESNLFVGKGNSYVSLSFTPGSFAEIFSRPGAYIHTKDQDFMLGASVKVTVEAGTKKETEETVIPVIAIECKTYLERNMLDSCAATARRLKNAMPYCVYIVAAEYMKMEGAAPELTDIDEVYIMCRRKNSDREARKRSGLPPYDIDANLVTDLFERVVRHLKAIWWHPEDAIENGRIINRPL